MHGKERKRSETQGEKDRNAWLVLIKSDLCLWHLSSSSSFSCYLQMEQATNILTFFCSELVKTLEVLNFIRGRTKSTIGTAKRVGEKETEIIILSLLLQR